MKKILNILLCLITLCLSSCKEETLECGCEGKIQFTIEDSDHQEGFLYRNPGNPSGNVPEYNYGIWFAEKNCSNCVHTFLICNDNLLKELDSLPDIETLMDVTFSGYASNLCREPFGPADHTYNHITLTKIEIQ